MCVRGLVNDGLGMLFCPCPLMEVIKKASAGRAGWVRPSDMGPELVELCRVVEAW